MGLTLQSCKATEDSCSRDTSAGTQPCYRSQDKFQTRNHSFNQIATLSICGIDSVEQVAVAGRVTGLLTPVSNNECGKKISRRMRPKAADANNGKCRQISSSICPVGPPLRLERHLTACSGQ
ncbi:hypothetical protein NSE01_40740 [Novosphingobium sediminis]|uniref:Uncharacterized protein n=1 Tax=Novosphingobium sediminis TaxID=707214 RepID=A0A512ARE4_9SPHN|nr:hypothetical protein NSE01_40740 [Novosphingobium sediminis]